MMSNPGVWQYFLSALHAAMWGGSLLVALAAFSRFAAPLLAAPVMLNFATRSPSSFGR
jgi:hypothetical protein